MKPLVERLLVRSTAEGGAPFVALLGPPGSGKSYALELCSKELQRSPYQESIRLIKLLLRDVHLASESQMQAELLQKANAQLRQAGISTAVRPPASDFMGFFCAAAASTALRVIVLFEQFDAAPRFLSRLLARQFRALYEHSERDPAVRNIGIIVAGTLSLFELKREVDSAFTTFETEQLPLSRIDRLPAVLSMIPSDLDLAPGVVSWIVEKIGPEPAFLTQVWEIIKTLKKKSRTPSPTDIATQYVKAGFPAAHLLRRNALALWYDPHHYWIVADLLKASGRVPLYEPAVDVDRYQLLGVVRVENDCYVFLGHGFGRLVPCQLECQTRSRVLGSPTDRVSFFPSSFLLSPAFYWRSITLALCISRIRRNRRR